MTARHAAFGMNQMLCKSCTDGAFIRQCVEPSIYSRATSLISLSSLRRRRVITTCAVASIGFIFKVVSGSDALIGRSSSPVTLPVEEGSHEGQEGDVIHVNVSATSKDVASLARPTSRVEVHLKMAELGSESGNSVLSKSLMPNVLLSRGAIKVPPPDKSASKKKRIPKNRSPSKLPEINQSPQKYKSGMMPQHLLALLPEGFGIASQDRDNENASASGESRSSTALSGVRHRHGGSGKWQSPFEARKKEDGADRQSCVSRSMSEVGHDSLAEALKQLKDQPVNPEALFKSRRAAAATPPSRGSSYVGGDDDYMDHHSESLRSRGGTPYEFVHLEDSERNLLKSGGSNLTGVASDHTGPLEEEVSP